MLMEFTKYQGAGNDFILFDNRNDALNTGMQAFFAKICHRRFGIGADGVMLLQLAQDVDFEMVYINADGYEGSLCGNGSRCMVKFAHRLGIRKEAYTFLAADGIHEAKLDKGVVRLKMHDVTDIKHLLHYYELNTGSPHYVEFFDNIAGIDVREQGAKIRFSDQYKQAGINVNFVECTDGRLSMRTYERGVEDETYACGTGVTAAALAYAIDNKLPAGYYNIPVQVLGGELMVSFEKLSDTYFTEIWLSGPADFVYSGVIDTEQFA